uniref:Uncharacterized protein n=1 Tax=Tanacetum cinerariifolium TaxID=118510 RepID=A0A6L2JHN3_TANCI|nr:hypothetical protein [Tanacetum cinerariifolium]
MSGYGVVCDPYGNVGDEVLAIPIACLEAGAGLAELGKLTLHAFLNGRLDLSQAEDVGKLLSAKSVAAADAALAGIQGGFSSLVKSLTEKCIELFTEIEA